MPTARHPERRGIVTRTHSFQRKRSGSATGSRVAYMSNPWLVTHTSHIEENNQYE